MSDDFGAGKVNLGSRPLRLTAATAPRRCKFSLFAEYTDAASTPSPRAYHQQLHLFSQAILRHFPEGTRISRPEGSFVLWIEMPPGVDTLRLHREALKHRISIAPGALFSVKDRFRNCLRMNCGLPWTGAIEAALRTLGDLAKKQL